MQRTDDLTHRSSQIEVCPSLSLVQVVRLHEVGQFLVADNQPVVAAAGEQGLGESPDESRHRPRIADRPQGESQSAQHPILGGSVQFGAQLRHRIASDGHEFAHQQAPQLGFVDGVIELSELDENLSRPIRRLLRQGLDELSGRLQSFFRRNLRRDEHVVGGRLSVLHDDRWLLPGVPGHAHAANIHEVRKVLSRGRTQGEPARLIHRRQPKRRDSSSCRLRRPDQPEHDRLSRFGDGDRLACGRVDDLAGDESAAEERERRQFDLFARQAFTAGHRDADAILCVCQKIVAPFRHHQAKPSGGVRGNNRLAPFVKPPCRDHHSRGGLSGDFVVLSRCRRDTVGHRSRHNTASRQCDDDIGR